MLNSMAYMLMHTRLLYLYFRLFDQTNINKIIQNHIAIIQCFVFGGGHFGCAITMHTNLLYLHFPFIHQNNGFI